MDDKNLPLLADIVQQPDIDLPSDSLTVAWQQMWANIILRQAMLNKAVASMAEKVVIAIIYEHHCVEKYTGSNYL